MKILSVLLTLLLAGSHLTGQNIRAAKYREQLTDTITPTGQKTYSIFAGKERFISVFIKSTHQITAGNFIQTKRMIFLK